MRHETEMKIHPKEFQGDIGRRIFRCNCLIICNYDILTLTSNLKISVPRNVKSRGEVKWVAGTASYFTFFFLHTIGKSLCDKLDVSSTIKLRDAAVLLMQLITYTRKLYVSLTYRI